MSESATPILELLERRFPGRAAINRCEFRELLDLSHATDARLKREGKYPPILAISAKKASRTEGRILLTELATWLESMQRQALLPAKKTSSGKKLGRPIGSKNKAATASEYLGF